MIAEQKIRTQRLLGELIKAGQDAGEIAKRGDFGEIKQGPVSTARELTGNKLSDIGISAKQSSIFQQIARILFILPGRTPGRYGSRIRE